jgi:hypothetical protein
MAKGYGGPVIVPLYGVPIRAVMESGDKELMKSMLKVSDYLMSQSKAGHDDWAAAHGALKNALG